MFTKKNILGYVAASFLIASAIAGPAQASITLNGLSFNGMKLNGIKLNGLRLNGLRLNGTWVNGSDKIGVADKDRETRGFDFNGVTTRSIILNVPQRWEAK